MRAAIYTRVSSTEQARGGFSLEMQETRCREAATAAGAIYIEVFSDPGCSGTKMEKRPDLRRFLSRLEEFDRLYVWKLDRFGRNLRDVLNMLGTLDAQGVEFVSVTEPQFDKTGMGQAMLQIGGSFAQLASALTSERTLEGHQATRLKGQYLGRVPIGYRRPTDAEGNVIPKATLEVVPEEAAKVREFFQLYADGMSLESLCRHATAEQVRTRFGGKWWPTTMRTLLENDTYLGTVRLDGERIPGRHEAIIAQEVWDQVQARLQANRGVNPKARATSLTPLLRCGYCGSAVQIHRDRDGNQRYKCKLRVLQPAEQRHLPLYVARAKVDDTIWACVRWLIGEQVLQEAQARAAAKRRRGEEGKQRQQLQEQFDKLTRQMERNLQLNDDGALPVDILTRKNRELRLERDSVERHLQGLAKPLVMLPDLTVESMMKLLQEANVEKQRQFLQNIFERVELYRDCLTLVPAMPGLEPVTVAVPQFYAPNRGHRITAETLKFVDDPRKALTTES